MLNYEGLDNVTFHSNMDYHLRQYAKPYNSTTQLIEFIRANIDSNSSKTVLDLGCGGGANIYWLKKAFPNWSFTGVDFDPLATKLASEKNADHKFYTADILSLEKAEIVEPFDLVLNLQVIVTAPFNIYDFLNNVLHLVKKDLIITSLFSDAYFEQETIRHDLVNGKKFRYKIDSLPNLSDFVYRKFPEFKLHSQAYEPKFDIPKPKETKLATYTITLNDQTKMEVSPYMLMPWYTVLLSR